MTANSSSRLRIPLMPSSIFLPQFCSLLTPELFRWWLLRCWLLSGGCFGVIRWDFWTGGSGGGCGGWAGGERFFSSSVELLLSTSPWFWLLLGGGMMMFSPIPDVSLRIAVLAPTSNPELPFESSSLRGFMPINWAERWLSLLVLFLMDPQKTFVIDTRRKDRPLLRRTRWRWWMTDRGGVLRAKQLNWGARWPSPPLIYRLCNFLHHNKAPWKSCWYVIPGKLYIFSGRTPAERANPFWEPSPFKANPYKISLSSDRHGIKKRTKHAKKKTLGEKKKLF